MGLIELIVIALSLSCDAFAVSICKGLAMARVKWAHAFVIALSFGIFQGGMTFIGWALGTQFTAFIEPIDHWIAFVLLAFIGAKMLADGIRSDGECAECGPDAGASTKFDMKEILALSVATSIDALAIGISFSFLSVNIALASMLIGVVTFALSIVGVVAGTHIGARFNRPATIAGGIVLILIGVKILIEHLFA